MSEAENVLSERLGLYCMGQFHELLLGRPSQEPAISIRLDLVYLQSLRRCGRLKEAFQLRNVRIGPDEAPYFGRLLDLGLGASSLPRVLDVCREADDRWLAYLAHGMDLVTRGRHWEAEPWLDLVMRSGAAAHYHPVARAELANCKRARKDAAALLPHVMRAARAECTMNRRSQALVAYSNCFAGLWLNQQADHEMMAEVLAAIADLAGPGDELLALDLRKWVANRLGSEGREHPLLSAEPDPKGEPALAGDRLLESELASAKIDVSDADLAPVLIRVLRDVPPFIGPDLRTKSLCTGEELEVPTVIARILFQHRCAELVMRQEGSEDTQGDACRRTAQ